MSRTCGFKKNVVYAKDGTFTPMSDKEAEDCVFTTPHDNIMIDHIRSSHNFYGKLLMRGDNYQPIEVAAKQAAQATVPAELTQPAKELAKAAPTIRKKGKKVKANG